MLELNFVPFPEIETDRLLLRRMKKEDAPEFLFLRSNDDVMRYIGRNKMKTIEEAEGFIEKINGSIDNRESIMWTVTLKDEPATMIGTICLWNIQQDHMRSEIGYILHPQYWNRGMMKEAVLAVVDYGFSQIKLHSIEGRINPDNAVSGYVLEKTGFVKEAHFREDFYWQGKFSDTAVYSILAP